MSNILQFPKRNQAPGYNYLHDGRVWRVLSVGLDPVDLADVGLVDALKEYGITHYTPQYDVEDESIPEPAPVPIESVPVADLVNGCLMRPWKKEDAA